MAPPPPPPAIPGFPFPGSHAPGGAGSPADQNDRLAKLLNEAAQQSKAMVATGTAGLGIKEPAFPAPFPNIPVSLSSQVKIHRPFNSNVFLETKIHMFGLNLSFEIAPLQKYYVKSSFTAQGGSNWETTQISGLQLICKNQWFLLPIEGYFAKPIQLIFVNSSNLCIVKTNFSNHKANFRQDS